MGVGVAVSVGAAVAVAVGLGVLVAVGDWVSVGAGVAEGNGRSVGTSVGTITAAACGESGPAVWPIPSALSLQAFRMSRLKISKIHGLSPTLSLIRLIAFSKQIFPNQASHARLFPRAPQRYNKTPQTKTPQVLIRSIQDLL